jgi:hypothetical protein
MLHDLGEKAASVISAIVSAVNNTRVGYLVSITWAGPALTQEAAAPCPGPGGNAIDQLVTLINHLQAVAIEIALPAAALAYTGVGLLWIWGTPEAQRRARRWFVKISVGLAIVLISDALVDVIATPLCGGA